MLTITEVTSVDLAAEQAVEEKKFLKCDLPEWTLQRRNGRL
jgi:hypothetical protein